MSPEQNDNCEVLPQSRRPDGTLRPQVRVKKGYVPLEEGPKYDRWKGEPDDGTPVGATTGSAPKPSKSKTALKNEKRKEKKKQEDATGEGEMPGGEAVAAAPVAAATAAAPVAATPPPGSETGEGAPSEVEKKLKALRKRVRQVEDLMAKAAAGATLNPDQAAKVEGLAALHEEIAKWETYGEVDIGKKVKNLKKKMRQIDELEARLASGLDLNEDQKMKVDAKAETTSELAVLEAMLQ